jgi:hypothetical protein
MSVPEHALVHPQEPAFFDEGFDQAFDVANGKAGHAGEALIGNLGMLAKEVGFGEDGVQNNAFGAGNLDTAVNSL